MDVAASSGPDGPSEFSAGQIRFLLSARGRSALADLVDVDLSDGNRLKLVQKLRRSFCSSEASALVTQVVLRRKASSKFEAADRLLFTTESLQQATAQPIAHRRAQWIDRLAPPGPILDLGCGIGGDLIELARYRDVIGYELAADRAALARANAEALGLDHRVQIREEDWTKALRNGSLPRVVAAFADPARRRGERRLLGLNQMIPPLSAFAALQSITAEQGIKVAPGVDDREIPAGSAVEFISHDGVCKEATLWFGALVGHSMRRAAVYRESGWHTIEASGRRPPLGALDADTYLHEPDPAVIRAGPFFELAAMLDAHLIDPHIAYLAGPRDAVGTGAEPFVRTFQVDEVHKMSLKSLNRRLLALQIGSVELKKRGVPIEPEDLRTRLKLTPGGRAAVILFTRRGDERIMILARRVDTLSTHS